MKKLFSICLLCLMALVASAQADNTNTRRFRLKTLPPDQLISNVYYYVVDSVTPSGYAIQKQITYSSDTCDIDFQAPVGMEITIGLKHDNVNWAYHSDVAKDIFKLVDWRENGEVTANVVNSKRNHSYKYVMPDYDVELVGTFEYTPAPPTDQPGTNGWYPETGTLVFDYSDIMPLGFTDADREKVTRIIIGSWYKQDISTYFFNHGWSNQNLYPNCRIADYSRATSPFIDYADWSNIGLTDVILPSTMKKISGQAFIGLSTLTTLTCYAMTPPAIEPKVVSVYNSETGKYEKDTIMPFDVCPDVVIRVPADVVVLYQRADYWKNFNILAIDEDYSTLAVNLMPVVDDERKLNIYKNMHLELTNTRTGIMRSMLVNGRNTYEFRYLPSNTSYDLVLRSQTGAVVASLDNIFITNEDKTVTFDRLRSPHKLTISLTADGQPVKGELFTNTWFTAEGTFLGRGSELENVFDDQELRFVIGLERELAMQYAQIDTVNYVVGQQPDAINIALQPLPQTDVTFRISDERTGQGIASASVIVTQMFSDGTAGKAQQFSTDVDGVASGRVLSTMSNIIVTADAYGSKNYIVNLSDSTDLAFKLQKAEGTTITVNWTYRRAVYPEESASVTPGYDGMNQMQMEFLNYSTYKTITDYLNQSPRYTLFETLPKGTRVNVKAKSLADKVETVSGSGYVDSLGQVSVTLNVVERATLHASYFQSEGLNPSVLLFRDGSDNVVRRATFDPEYSFVDFTNLPSGKYKVVAMTAGETYDAVTNRFQLARLTEGSDYVSQTVTLSDGQNQRVSFTKIPLTGNTLLNNLSTRRAYFKQRQVSVGEYATVSVTATFKNTLTATPKEPRLVFRVPKNCKLVDNSIIIGKKQASYQYNSSTRDITINWPDIETDSVIRFCIVPQQPGEYRGEASLYYTLDGEEHADPLLSSVLTAVSAVINVPEVVNTPRFKVSGKSAASYDASYSRAGGPFHVSYGRANDWNQMPPYDVQVYDGDQIIGNAYINSNGEWDTWVTLKEPTALSHHTIWASVIRNGVGVETERKEVVYDSTAVVPKTLTMSYFNHHPVHLEQMTVVFDYINDVATPSHYGFSNEEGYNTDFTFEVDLSNNDTTKVYACALYIHTAGPEAEERIALCHYNARKNRWIAYEKFNTRSLPYDVYVEPFYYHDNIGSRREMDNAYAVYDDLFKEDTGAAADLCRQLRELISQGQQQQEQGSVSEAVAKAVDEKLQQWLSLRGLTDREVEDTGQTVDELVAEADALWSEVGGIADYFGNIQQYAKELNELGTIAEGITTDTAAGMTADDLKAQGYTENRLDDGSIIYIRATDDGGWNFVDLKRNLHMSVTGEAAARLFISSHFRAADSWDDWFNTIQNLLDKFQDYLGKISEACSAAIYKFNYWIYMAEDTSVKLGKELSKLEPGSFRHWWVSTKLDLNLEKINTMTKVRSFCEKFKIGKAVGTLGGLYSLYANYVKFRDNNRKIYNIKNSIPKPCPDDQADADKLLDDIRYFSNWSIPYLITTLTSDVVTIGVASGLFAALIPSGGTTIVPLGVTLFKIGVQIGANLIYDQRVEDALYVFQMTKNALICYEKDPNCVQRGDCPKCTSDCDDYPKGPKGPKGPKTTGDLDPSGYVYEGVASNRVEGATATVYYRTTEKDMYGDNVEKIVMWNAEDFDQVNPQQTDRNGEYGWMVPAGEWQVKYEKEGYQTAYSDWLPVPPPQLDVNQELSQYSQPEVKAVKATQEGVQVTFSKYMRPTTLTTDNIFVSRDGNVVEGSIELLDAEEDDRGQQLASRVRFVPADGKLPVGQTLLLTVSADVESYAKVNMGQPFAQEFDIVPAVERIVADSVISVVYDQPYRLTISAQPANVAAGRKVNVELYSDIVASVSTTEVTLDTDGRATIDIYGEAHGTTAIAFTLADDADVKTLTMVNVKDASDFITPMPSANYMSGTQLYHGTQVELTCSQYDAVIWYTTDGSCPCDQQNANAKRYTGPITITANTLLKAMAVAPGFSESEINELYYVVRTDSTRLHLSTGWNWVSLAQANALPVATLGDATDYALNADGETVTTLEPAQAYLVRNNRTTDTALKGFAWDPRHSTVNISKGWNWIAYPYTKAALPTDVLLYAQPKNGDILLGEDGFAIYITNYYRGDQWYGTLQAMAPGRAYRYKTDDDNRLLLLNNVLSDADTIANLTLPVHRWYDRHAWADRMPVIARLRNTWGSTVSGNASQYELIAFCGDDCRGNGYWVNINGSNYAFINVLGQEGQTISFIVHDKKEDKYYAVNETIDYTADLQGDPSNPVWLSMGDEVSAIQSVTAKSAPTEATYTLQGVKMNTDSPLRKGIYVQGGQKIVVRQ